AAPPRPAPPPDQAARLDPGWPAAQASPLPARLLPPPRYPIAPRGTAHAHNPRFAADPESAPATRFAATEPRLRPVASPRTRLAPGHPPAGRARPGGRTAHRPGGMPGTTRPAHRPSGAAPRFRPWRRPSGRTRAWPPGRPGW